jgi:hypothetical protein
MLMMRTQKPHALKPNDSIEKTHILTMLYRSHLTIFSIDNQYEKGAKKNALEWSTTAYFPHK